MEKELKWLEERIQKINASYAKVWWPQYYTHEEIIEQRRNLLNCSIDCINREQAIRQFELNPDIEFEKISLNDIAIEIGILPYGSVVGFGGYYLVEKNSKERESIIKEAQQYVISCWTMRIKYN